jgi:hypothetical protein
VKKNFIPAFITLLFLTSCLLLTPQAGSTPEVLPPTAIPAAEYPTFQNGLAVEYHPILDELPHASLYTIDLVIADSLYQITGRQSVVYTNAEEVPLNEVQFRLFPNILGGKMDVEKISVNGKPVKPTYSLNNSLLIIPLEEPLNPDEKVTISMDFKISVPQSVDLNYGVQAYYDNILTLAHAYPMIAVYDDEGWNAEIPPQSGDVAYADMSFFIVTVNAPEKVTLAATGVEASRQDNGSRQTVRYEAGPVRDFYLAGSPEYEVFVKESNGITLRFYTRDHLQAGAEYALDVAARSIEMFSRRYAPYPYTELDFVSTPTYALGIEYPGMIAVTEWIMAPENPYLEATVVHEVAHQWFYNLVGNDQLDEPWLDESLAQFVTLQYFTNEYGEAGDEAQRADITGRWNMIGNQAIPVGLPVSAYSGAEYSGIVYGRGALFFEALREEMGGNDFDLFIKSYVEDNAWGIGTAEILRANAETSCGCDLSGLFEAWIYP